MEFRLLGPLEVVHDGRLLALGRPRERALLTLLLITPNRVVSAERLVEELWDGRPPDGAIRALRVFVSRLRRTLRDAGAEEILATQASGYMVRVDPDVVDSVRFEAGIARARAAAADGDHDKAAAELTAALSLWRGQALADASGSPMARGEAARLAEMRLGAIEARIDADLACGRHAQLVGELEGLTRTHPVREGLWGARMRALYRCGRQAEALQVYADLRRFLADELGLSPCAALAELESAILHQDTGLDWRPPANAPRLLAAGDTAKDEIPQLSERTPHVGRSLELEELHRLLRRATAGRGVIALVSGEAGIGKTRLTQELASLASQGGLRTWVGRCYESDGSPPYVPFVELFGDALEQCPERARELLGDQAPEMARLIPRLRRRWPDLPRPLELPADQERRYLFDSLHEVLVRASTGGPLVLVLEDLHWADEPTLLLLEHLTGGIEALPLVVVGTHRDPDPDTGGALRATLERLVRGRPVKRIALRRLPEAGVGEMLEALAGRRPPAQLVELIHSQTEGNPFFVEEIYKHLAEEGRLFDTEGQFRADAAREPDVPDTLRLVLGRRLDHLPHDTRRTLDSAAVVGRAFTYHLLELMGDLPPDVLRRAVDDAERAGLVVPMSSDVRDPRLWFGHELVRQTILAALPRPRRQRLHLSAAHALERTAGDAVEAVASEIVGHLTRSGPSVERATLRRYLTLAGRHAMSSAGFEDALRHFEDAAALTPAAEPALQAELFVDVARARRSLGRLQDAVEAWTAAIDAYETAGDAEGMAGACAEAAEDLLMCNRDQDGLDIARRGLAALGEAITPLRARILGWAANMGGWIAPYDTADTYSGQAIALATSLGDERLLGRALLNESSFRFAYYQLGRTASCSARAVELLRGAGDIWTATGAQATTAMALLELGQLADAATACLEVKARAPRLGQFSALFCVDWVEVTLTLATANLADFEAAARSGLEAFAGLNFESLHLPRLGAAAFLRGDWDLAADLMEQAVPHELANRFHGVAWGPLLQLRAYRGERSAALEILDRCDGILPRPGRPNGYGSWQYLGCAVESMAVLGEQERCAALYPLAAEFAATEVVLTVPTGRLTQRVAGIAAAAARDWAAAEAHFDAALRLADELPHLLEAAEVRRFYARMLLDRAATGDRDRATTLLTEAEHRYMQLGAPRHADLVAETLAQV